MIVDTRTGELVKVGISGQPLLNNGESPRANSQISPSNTNNKMNQLELLDPNDPNRYKVEVIEQNITREQALDIEQQVTDKHAARNGAISLQKYMKNQYHK